MAAPQIQLDRLAVHAQVLATARQLLAELGNERALEALHGSAHLDRDLGLGSLERVELMLRLDNAFGTRLPDRAVAEAGTLDDLVAALLHTLERNASAAASPAQLTWSPLRGAAARADAFGLPFAETLLDVLHHRAHADADRPHVFLQEEHSGTTRETSITFGELYAGAEKLAGELARRGIVPGDPVAIMLPTSREFFLTFAGVLLAGAVPVPIYPPARADRIAEYAARQTAILRNAQARLLITFRQAESVARLLRPRVASLAGVVDAARLLAADSGRGRHAFDPRVSRKADDLALLQYTSGSTGEPKGVMLTHANLLANIRAIGEAVRARPDDVVVTWLPLYHDMGLIGTWLLPLYYGLPVVALSPVAFLTRPVRWLWAVHRHRATLGAAPNFAYELAVRKIADRDLEGLDLSSWRAALNGAEPVSPETLERFARRFAPYGLRPETQLPVYGLAEASLAVAIPPPGRRPRVDRIERETFEREGRAVSMAPNTPADDPGVISFVSVGCAVPEHEVHIVDTNGRDVGDRVEGTLWFRGPSVAHGYYRNPEATRALFPEGPEAGWVDSGDRAYRAEGEIYITGRTKDIVIKAGRNLYPHEIEELVGRVAGVRKGCVVAFGAADPANATERLVIVAETRERDAKARGQIARGVTRHLTSALGIPPDVVELVPPHAIPKTSSGKLRRAQTKAAYLAGKLGSGTAPAWMQFARLGGTSAAAVVRRGLRRALELGYGVYAAALFGLWIVPTWLLVLAAPNRNIAARITSPALRSLLALAGCRVRVEGREHLRQREPRVLVSNHTSYFDALVLMAALGMDYRFVAKSELRSWPFIRTFLRKLGHVAFDRHDPRARLRQAEEIEELLRRGESVCVFPEGTFTRQAGVRSFQLGAFKAAVATGRPVFPVALRGSRQFLRDGTLLPRPSRIALCVAPPLFPAASPSDADWHEVVRLRDAARSIIAQHCGEPLV